MDAFIPNQAFQGRGNQFRGNPQELNGPSGENVPGGVDMAVIDHFIQGEDNAGFDARRMVWSQSKRLGNAICGFEANAVDVAFELIWIFLNGLEGSVPIHFVNLDRQIGADTMRVQKKHDLLDLLLLLPGSDNFPRSVWTDAGHFQQAFGLLLNNFEGCFFEDSHDAFRHLRPDPFDHARAEIAFHSRNRGRESLFADFHVELFAVFWMGIPGS